MDVEGAGKNITLEIKRGTETAMAVNADKQKIRQVLVNLVENAIKYGNNKGHIDTGFYKMDDDHVYIEISDDDGPGIEEVHLPRLFERFYREIACASITLFALCEISFGLFRISHSYKTYYRSARTIRKCAE